MIEITIFGKRRKSKEGREFVTYFTELTNKNTGEVEKISVKFREECGSPKQMPCNIRIAKGDCNIAPRHYEDAEGVDRETKDLWVSKWEPGSEYVDHSMDDYF